MRTDDLLYLISLVRGTSDLLGVPKTVTRGYFFTPKLPLLSIFDLESLLVLNSLATSGVASNSNLVLAQFTCAFFSSSDRLQTGLPVSSLGTNLILWSLVDPLMVCGI